LQSGSHRLHHDKSHSQHPQVVHINLHYIVSCYSLDRPIQKQPSLCPIVTPEPARRLKVGRNVPGILLDRGALHVAAFPHQLASSTGTLVCAHASTRTPLKTSTCMLVEMLKASFAGENEVMLCYNSSKAMVGASCPVMDGKIVKACRHRIP